MSLAAVRPRPGSRVACAVLALLFLAALAGCPPRRPRRRPAPRSKAVVVEPARAKKPAHLKHEHGHLHPHPANDHHHHPHPHPHMVGSDGHHHPY